MTYDELAEMGRAAPGERVKVFTANRGTREECRRRIRRLRYNLSAYLEHKYPLERWGVSGLVSSDPWGGYELFVEYHGVAKDGPQKGKWKAQRKRQRRVSRSAEG